MKCTIPARVPATCLTWERLLSVISADLIGEFMRLNVPRFTAPSVLVLPVLLLSLAPNGYSIPAFSRQYQTSCATCHIDFPKLNDFGKAFKDAGFKFPKDDETYLKVPPVLLGAPA